LYLYFISREEYLWSILWVFQYVINPPVGVESCLPEVGKRRTKTNVPQVYDFHEVQWDHNMLPVIHYERCDITPGQPIALCPLHEKSSLIT